MSDIDDERRLGRLMSGRDGMSVDEREAIFDAVFAAVQDEQGEHTPEVAPAPATMGPSTRAFFALAACALAAIGALVFLSTPDSGSGETWVARGADAAPNTLELVCTTGEEVSACGPQATLSFKVRAKEATHVALFARSKERGSVLWYVPGSPDGRAASVTPGREVTLEGSVDLSTKHPTGEYSVYAVFATRPLTRDDVKAMMKDGPPSDSPDVVSRTLVMP